MVGSSFHVFRIELVEPLGGLFLFWIPGPAFAILLRQGYEETSFGGQESPV